MRKPTSVQLRIKRGFSSERAGKLDGGQRYIAFLRAINVGGRTVKMECLRTLFEKLGLTQVETFIASGNVAFRTSGIDADVLEKKIESHLREALGYEVATFLRTPEDLSSIAGFQPPAAPETSASAGTIAVAFLKAAPDQASWSKVLGYRTKSDDFRAQNREIFWLCRTRVSESKFTGGLLERAVGGPATMRNVTTVRKLAAKYPPEE